MTRVSMLAVLLVSCSPAVHETPEEPDRVVLPPRPVEARMPRPVPAECASPPPLERWIERPPYVDETDRRCANRDICRWNVSSRDGTIVVEPMKQEATPFDFLGGEIATRHVDDGWLVASDRGEFGADVFWFSEDRRSRKLLGGDNVSAMIDVAGETWLLAGLDHLGLHHGAVFRAEHAGARTWALVKIADLAWTARAAVADGDDALVATTTELVRVHRDGRVEKLYEQPEWLGVYPESIVVDRGRVLVGANHVVMRFTPKANGYEETWLVRPECAHMRPREHGSCECTP